MISLAIVGGLLMTLIYTLNYHLGITERQFVITRMTSLAKEKIREMENSPQTSEGRFPEPDQELRYKTESKDSNFPEMSEFVVTVETGKARIVLAELMRKQK